jgi:PHD/YefM family antitoxin component YafN of YafNO toxin-antitoxin module
MMSLDDYNNLMENLKVIKNPEYFIELYTSLQEFKKNKTITKSLDELEEMSK